MFLKWRFRNRVKNRLIISFLLILLIPSLVIGEVSYHKAKGTVDWQLSDSAQNDVTLANELLSKTIKEKCKISKSYLNDLILN